MTEQPRTAETLTRNQSFVLDTLAAAAKPLGAYAILDRLRGQGFRAPLQVYRALDKLLAMGLVHRVESLNAFVACRHSHNETHGVTAFTICKTCGTVREFDDTEITGLLREKARTDGFRPRATTIEITGFCAACGNAPAAP